MYKTNYAYYCEFLCIRSILIFVVFAGSIKPRNEVNDVNERHKLKKSFSITKTANSNIKNLPSLIHDTIVCLPYPRYIIYHRRMPFIY